MRDLRLIGVTESGDHLILGLPDGQRFRLPFDAALAAAVRPDKPRLAPLPRNESGGATPRDVQAMIRAGANREDVALRTGWTLAHIEAFEGPVLAERAYIADRARKAHIPNPAESDSPTTLAHRVALRLEERGVDPDTVEWDSARSAEGDWVVKISFVAGERQRYATWYFDVAGNSVVPKDDEARWLTQLPGAIEQEAPATTRQVAATRRPEDLPFTDLLPTTSELRASAQARHRSTTDQCRTHCRSTKGARKPARACPPGTK